MGTATYYLKAKFPQDVTEEKFKAIMTFWDEGVNAAKWWQEHRISTDRPTFWENFEKQFPIVSEMLDASGLKGADLAGKLSFGYSKDEIDNDINGDEFTLSAEVWHFAEWDHITEFIKTKFGAIRVAWQSAESHNYYPELYDNDEIIHNLLEKVPAATLLGIHPDLDELLEAKMKG